MLDIDDFRKKLKEIIKKRYAEGRQYLINSDIQELAKDFQLNPNQASSESNDLEKEILNEFLKQNVSKSAGDFPELEKSQNNLPNANAQYAIQKGKIVKRIIKTVSQQLKKDASMSEITSALNHKLNLGKSHAKTIARTAKIGQIRANFLIEAIGNGNYYYRYVGINDGKKRAFCLAHLNKIYHISEIVKMNNGQGLSVLIYMGGWNCRDRWQVATAEEYYAQAA
jgi:hypothetical protein